ncbi:biotin--[acetyl-CoA-carboxylase] ligase [Halovenus rubra]|uniref:Biotin--[acetyl-CoA-carboxylase] ligase n=2 Tax=Halovenus rubra TaxID=869890 RepID=A0ACC7E3R5_9EURY|nr:biotin--[acetyl-CoA-carboxylase] ligase [Halovenus rubra]
MQETRAQILEALSAEPVTGPELAQQLDVTRAAVWKHIEALREAGFEISSSGTGYELVEVPEYGGEAIEFGLEAPFAVEYHDEIGSTNHRAREIATDGNENVVVVADKQTGGRGRLNRDWSSPSGGIWLSVLLRPTIPPTHAPIVTMAAAVATARAVETTGVEPTIKWPNDILVDGKKLTGILTEMEGEADRISWLVVGIGLNANVDKSQLPEDADATSLQVECGAVDRRHVVKTVLETLSDLLAETDNILPAWRSLSGTLGRHVRVETPNGTVTGKAVDVAFPGALIVETDNGTERVTVGDCEHLRPQ